MGFQGFSLMEHSQHSLSTYRIEICGLNYIQMYLYVCFSLAFKARVHVTAHVEVKILHL